MEPWRHSAMLAFFMDDAEAFFERNRTGFLSSGIWQEDGAHSAKQALIATALAFGDEQVLIIRLLAEEFLDRSHILQKTREQRLERRMLSSDLETYKYKAQMDALTSLYNRATFMDVMREELGRASRGAVFSLLLIDIDNFKSINDTYGHLAGDSVLSSLGKLLRALLRRDDVAARYGGEEFAVVAPHTVAQQAMRLGEKLRSNIAEYPFEALPQVTVSIGCAVYQAGDSADALIQRADTALYEAKNNGKNMVCLGQGC